jgi:site-specific recombinase XerD
MSELPPKTTLFAGNLLLTLPLGDPAMPTDPLALPSAASITIPGVDALSSNPAAVYLAGLTSGAARTQQSALTQLAHLLGMDDPLLVPWAQLRYAHTTAIRARLQEAYAPATANRYLTALRRVLEEAWRLGLLERELMERACDLKPIKGSTVPAGRALDHDEIRALLEVCALDSSPAGVRDTALIALLYTTGLRRSEVAQLDVSAYTPSSGALRVIGKGRKERIVYVGAASPALADWLTLRGVSDGPLFPRAQRGGHVGSTRMSDQGVRDVLAKRASAAGVSHFSPHDFRRTFISDLLDAGADMAAAQHLAGHADPATTARYDRRGERAYQAAAQLLQLPRRTLPLDSQDEPTTVVNP